MIGVVGGGEPASVALHKSCGFLEAGRMKSVGFKFERWLDTVYMQRSLCVEDRASDWLKSNRSHGGIAAEGLGSFFLFACVIGSGIMAANLSGGNDAVALLGNTLATGAILFVLITMLGPISGAHMNPAVSLVAASRGELRWRRCRAPTSLAQLAFGILGAWAAHLMFDLPILQLSVKARTGLGQWTRRGDRHLRPDPDHPRHRPPPAAWVPASVALYITAAYWFTSSTSFANPAITVARSLSDTLRRDRAGRRAGVHRRAAGRRSACRADGALAVRSGRLREAPRGFAPASAPWRRSRRRWRGSRCRRSTPLLDALDDAGEAEQIVGEIPVELGRDRHARPLANSARRSPRATECRAPRRSSPPSPAPPSAGITHCIAR